MWHVPGVYLIFGPPFFFFCLSLLLRIIDYCCFVVARQDSFQQHDVQELCRVLFDALETTFQGTVNETLVNNLYQGEAGGGLGGGGTYVRAGREKGQRRL